MLEGEGDGAERRRIKGRKNWDNCNSIINKIYFKTKQTKKRKRLVNIDKVDNIKIKNFCLLKHIIKKVERQVIDRKRHF